MTDAVIVAIIGGIVSIVGLVVSVFIKKDQAELKTAQAALTRAQADLKAAQEAVHKQINSRMDELLELTRQASKAEGKLEEKQEQAVKRKPTDGTEQI